MAPPSAPAAEEEAAAETASTSQPSEPSQAPCLSCDECNRDCCFLCPSGDNMASFSLNKCLMVQALILLVLVLHFALSSQIVQQIGKFEPRASDELCKNPACDCNKDNDQGGYEIKCHCRNYIPNITKSFVLPYPSLIPANTTFLHISDCEIVEIVKSELRIKELNVPEWFGIQNVDTLRLDPSVALIGKNILISDVNYIPEFPNGILRLASMPDIVHSFTLSNISTVDVVRYKAFDSVLLSTKFEMISVIFRDIEESAFNVTILNEGYFSISNCTIIKTNGSSFRAIGMAVHVVGNHIGHVKSGTFEVKAGSIAFSYNFFFESVEKFAFDLTASQTSFFNNYFSEIEEDAFFKIKDPNRDTSNSFNFSLNTLNLIHSGSMNPSKAVNKHDAVLSNTFMNCSSSNIGWIWEAVFGSFTSKNTREFYQLLLARENDNICYNKNEKPHQQTCYLENVTLMYDPQSAENKINRFYNGSVNNEEICHYLINSSVMMAPTVILFVQIVCFYLVAFLIH